ncbi:alpha/beta-hydrolase [Xylariomycetidae sp. FL2044]|nr:alpha/beta-hydrolase [Xylariomycetidae sp. FL2044]
MNTATVGMAVTPTVLSTFVSHYLNRKPLRERPTAHLSYDEGLHLIRSFLTFASHHTVEDIQAFTAQWVPHPQWVKVDEVEVPEDKLKDSAKLLQDQLGADGIRKIGGSNWWQWRKYGSPLKAEWIEMRSDYNERKKTDDPGKRIMLYVHGGGYYFGSIDEHRYQLQRYARKIKARVFAPEYRLAPQFPFPCGLQDCIAAYLYLLDSYDPTSIILAGDSAGGGMVVSLLVTLRDRGIPLPAGAILVSPWVDLTHSFPSVAGDAPLDYIPQSGFHHKPSKAWPPLNADEFALLREQVTKNTKLGQTKLMKPASVESKRLSQDITKLDGAQNSGERSKLDSLAETAYISINLDGKEVQLKDQIQMYATNELISHPLVSPVLQPTLGGLPPLLIMVGGGEILRDEQIYLAHKCANPAKYPPGDIHMHESAREQLARFKPTDVQLQVWDDLCHVAPTLSFTRPAKYMYRSAAQFGAWALARAQKRDIEIMDDDDISVISSSGSDDEGTEATPKKGEDSSTAETQPAVGKAGDPLPPFKSHMIRQRVNRHGVISPLDPPSDLPGCTLDPNEVGVVKEGPVRKWLETRHQFEIRFGSTRAKVHKQRLKEMLAGYEGFDGESPPPSALAARRKAGYVKEKKKVKSMGLALWSLWGSKHDEATVNREEQAEKAPEVKAATLEEGEGARKHSDLEKQEEKVKARRALLGSRSRSRTKVVRDEHQVAEDDGNGGVGKNTPIAVLMAKREENEKLGEPLPSPSNPDGLLSPNYVPPATGVTGKRPTVSGIAVPFSLNREAETASMITLTSNLEPPSRVASPRPMSPESGVDVSMVANTSAAAVAAATEHAKDEVVDPEDVKGKEPFPAAANGEEDKAGTPRAASPQLDGAETPRAGSPGPVTGDAKTMNGTDGAPSATIVTGNMERPGLETFVTAQEDLPLAK